MIFSSIVKLGKPISPMWIKFSIYYLSTIFFLKWYKFSFGASEVEYLGHIVDKNGVQVDPKKIEDMKDWPCPKTLKIL
jgi:hypothetical protein